MIDTKLIIRNYLKEQLRDRLEKKCFILFSEREIIEELERRNEIEMKKLDRVKYPELSHS